MARDIVTDGADVFWANEGDGTVAKVGVCGGGVTVLAMGQSKPFRLAIDVTRVYWTAAGSGLVQSVPKTGGAVTMLAQGTPGTSDLGLAVDATSLYWNTGAGMITKLPSGGGAGTTFASTTPSGGIVVDTANVIWPGFAQSNTLGVWRCAVGVYCASPTSIGSILSFTSSLYIALDGVNAYWTENHPATSAFNVLTAPKAGGATVKLAANQASPHGIATDGINVYWANGNDGSINRCAVGGCGMSPAVLATGGSVWGIALDATSVYWANITTGAITKIAK